MPAPIPTAVLCLITGLAAGTAGGYFWGADSQPAASANTEQARSEVASNAQAHSANLSTGLSAAIQNPTGLRLVGTIVQPDHAKSKAWLLEVATNNTQAYGEGDALPGGYKLTTIGAEDLKVTKDGYSFSIRRSSSSTEAANTPCEALAQNASNAQNTRGGIPESGRHAAGPSATMKPKFGFFGPTGRQQTSGGNQPASAQASSGSSQSGAGVGGSGSGSSNGSNNGSNNGNGSSSASGKASKASRGWGERAPIADGEEVRSTSGDALSTLPADGSQ